MDWWEFFWDLLNSVGKGMQFFSSVNTTPIAPPNHLCAEYRLQPSNTKDTLDSRARNKTLDPSGCTVMHGGSLTVIISLSRPLSTDRNERCCHRHSTGKEVKASESFAFSFPVGPPSAKKLWQGLRAQHVYYMRHWPDWCASNTVDMYCLS